MTRIPDRLFVIVDDNTIRETRDRQEEKRPRKRQRVDSDVEDPPSVPPTTSGSVNAKKQRPGTCFSDVAVPDPEFYKEDPTATCVIRVKQTLFKIHKELLDCCPFMLELLEEHEKGRGPTSEDNPLLFVLPTVEEYRAFLWALYASADELMGSSHEHQYLERLPLIASITQKYDIPRLREWVCSAVHRTATDTVFMESCSSANLTHLVETCVNYKFTDTLTAVIGMWSNRLEQKGTPSVPAILAADKHDLKDLRGVAYYVHVQDMIDRQTSTEKGATQLRADPKLNNGQVMRLLTGYLSLVSLWERQRMKPLSLVRSASCTDEAHTRCSATWDRRWTSAAGWKRILGISSADVLALLACLRDQLTNDDDLKAGTNPECRLAGLEALKDLRTKTQLELADHFFGIV